MCTDGTSCKTRAPARGFSLAPFRNIRLSRVSILCPSTASQTRAYPASRIVRSARARRRNSRFPPKLTPRTWVPAHPKARLRSADCSALVFGPVSTIRSAPFRRRVCELVQRSHLGGLRTGLPKTSVGSPVDPRRELPLITVALLCSLAGAAQSGELCNPRSVPLLEVASITILTNSALLQNKTRERSTPPRGQRKGGHGGWRSLSLSKQALLPLVASLLSRL